MNRGADLKLGYSESALSKLQIFIGSDPSKSMAGICREEVQLGNSLVGVGVLGEFFKNS